MEYQEEPEEQEAGAPMWMVTFGDMMSLLLTFFVLMLSFSEIDRVAFAQIMGSLKEAFGVQKMVVETNPVSQPNPSPVHQIGNSSGDGLLDKLNSILPGAFAGGNRGGDEDEDESKGRLKFSYPGSLLFPSGESTLKEGFVDKLDEIAKVLREEPSLELHVFGHTDDRPIHTPRFHNNWELSGSRASNVIKYLIDAGKVPAERLVAIGFADTRPLVTNDTPENRTKNRRVEFLFIERQDGEGPILGR